MLGDSRCDLLASGTSNRKKHLDKFFKICHTGFWRLVRDSFQSRKTRVLHNEGYFQGSFHKTFQFSLTFCDFSLSCPFLSLTNSPCLLQNPSFFFIISSPIFKNKVWVFLFSQRFLCLKSLNSWILYFWWVLKKNDVRILVWVFLVEFDEWILLVLTVWCLLYIFSCLLFIFE